MLDHIQKELSGQDELHVIFVKEDVLVDGKPLVWSPHNSRVAGTFYRKNIGYLRFFPGISLEELHMLVRLGHGDIDNKTFKKSVHMVELGDVDVHEQDDAEVRPISTFEELSEEELDGLKEFYKALGEKKDINLKKLTSVVAGFVGAIKQGANPLLALVPLRMEDEYTFVHSINVSILNIAQASSLGFEGQQLRDIGIAGMLHDAGKIFIDKEIIRKPGEMTDEELEKMKTHPARGAQYLMKQPNLPKIAVIAAYEHHLHYDKSGYPTVPEDWTLNMVSQITMISDIFDALRTRRSYKDPWDFPKISGIMLELAGKHLNPYLTINFLNIISRYGDGLVTEGEARPNANPCC
jgi:HD-GYP domain-containing protein (c-di-GMP phosphodiesterase class II)